jgi:hypothetical protein
MVRMRARMMVMMRRMMVTMVHRMAFWWLAESAGRKNQKTC